ncbi:hypothetical protein ACFU8X_29420 [Brevibacillus porteri]|uniref:hypothetical protein n=1 Tax=Brevibacillus porteri TaxID=2126350 RepID=UPI003709C7F0
MSDEPIYDFEDGFDYYDNYEILPIIGRRIKAMTQYFLEGTLCGTKIIFEEETRILLYNRVIYEEFEINHTEKKDYHQFTGLTIEQAYCWEDSMYYNAFAFFLLDNRQVLQIPVYGDILDTPIDDYPEVLSYEEWMSQLHTCVVIKENERYKTFRIRMKDTTDFEVDLVNNNDKTYTFSVSKIIDGELNKEKLHIAVNSVIDEYKKEFAETGISKNNIIIKL